jgi:hypothetical protein
MSVLATQPQTTAQANTIVRFSRDSSSPTAEAPTANTFLANSVLTISAVLRPENLKALYQWLSGGHFDQQRSLYGSYNGSKTLTRQCEGVLGSVTIRTSLQPDNRIGPSTVFSTAYRDASGTFDVTAFLEAKIADTAARLEVARENQESVRLEAEAREAVETTVAVAYGNPESRDSLSPETQEELVAIESRYCALYGDRVNAIGISQG